MTVIKKILNKNNYTNILSAKLLVTVSVLIISVIVLFLFVSGCGGNSVTDNAVYKVKRQNLIISVLAKGELKAQETLQMKSEVKGRAIIIKLIPEATIVTEKDVEEGLVLCELDSSDLESKLTDQEIQLRDKDANKAKTKGELEIQRSQNESNIMSGEQELRFARMDLDQYIGAILSEKLVADLSGKGGPSIQNNLFDTQKQKIDEDTRAGLVEKDVLQTDGVIGFDFKSLLYDGALDGEALQRKRKLESDIELAKEEVAKQENALAWTEKLESKGYVTKNDLVSDQLSLKRRKIAQLQAETAFDIFLRYGFSKEIESKFSGYKKKIMELERIRKRANYEIIRKEAAFKSAQDRYSLQKKNVDKIKEQIDKCIIKATKAGIIVYGKNGNSRWSAAVKEGDTVRENQIIVEIPDVSSMGVEALVHESSVNKILAGQRAVITVDALPGRRFKGEVKKISLLANQENWMNQGVKEYATTVIVKDDYDNLRPGMSSQVEIIVQKLENVIAVPLQSVTMHQGKRVCYVKKRGSYKPVEVDTGLSNNKFIEIKSGLGVDQKVLLAPPETLYETGQEMSRKKSVESP